MAEFEVCKARKYPEVDIKLPERSTTHAAGYDFFAPDDFEILPGEQKLIWTDVKIKLEPGQFLLLLPRSSYGIKKHLMLANTCGVVDMDYYNNPDNEGNIGICLYNYNSPTTVIENTAYIKKGDRIAQGIIMNYETTEDEDNVKHQRQGGFGSTGE